MPKKLLKNLPAQRSIGEDSVLKRDAVRAMKLVGVVAPFEEVRRISHGSRVCSSFAGIEACVKDWQTGLDDPCRQAKPTPVDWCVRVCPFVCIDA